MHAVDLMTRGNPNPEGKLLIIGGGIANFTNVASTFKGIIRALKQFQQQLQAHKVKIFVRRGGPNYQEGLKAMRLLGETLGVEIQVCLLPSLYYLEQQLIPLFTRHRSSAPTPTSPRLSLSLSAPPSPRLLPQPSTACRLAMPTEPTPRLLPRSSPRALPARPTRPALRPRPTATSSASRPPLTSLPPRALGTDRSTTPPVLSCSVSSPVPSRECSTLTTHADVRRPP